jgi:hypothetical protein
MKLTLMQECLEQGVVEGFIRYQKYIMNLANINDDICLKSAVECMLNQIKFPQESTNYWINYYFNHE